MQHNDDPRNIFFNQRQEYAESKTSAQNVSNQTVNGGNFGANNGQTDKNGGSTANNGAKNSDYEEKVRQMKQLAAKYEREGEGQLVKDILNNVIEQKAAGTLSNDQLIAFCKRISPLLNAEQRTRLNGLLQELLKI